MTSHDEAVPESNKLMTAPDMRSHEYVVDEKKVDGMIKVEWKLTRLYHWEFSSLRTHDESTAQ